MVLTPTLYGVPNDLLYFENSRLTAEIDGWATWAAAAIGLGTYRLVGALHCRSEAELLVELEERKQLRLEQDATPAVPAGAAAR